MQPRDPRGCPGNSPTTQRRTRHTRVSFEDEPNIVLPDTTQPITNDQLATLQEAIHHCGFGPPEDEVKACIITQRERLSKATKLRQQADIIIGQAKRTQLNWETKYAIPSRPWSTPKRHPPVKNRRKRNTKQQRGIKFGRAASCSGNGPPQS